MAETQTTNAHGWKMYDIDFGIDVNDENVKLNLVPWFNENNNIQSLQKAKSQFYVEGYNRYSTHAFFNTSCA